MTNDTTTATTEEMFEVLHGLERVELGARAVRLQATEDENIMMFSISATLEGLGTVTVSDFQAELATVHPEFPIAPGTVVTRPRFLNRGIVVEIGERTLVVSWEQLVEDRRLFEAAQRVVYAALEAWRTSTANAAEAAVFGV